MKKTCAHCQNRLVTYGKEIRRALIKLIHYKMHRKIQLWMHTQEPAVGRQGTLENIIALGLFVVVFFFSSCANNTIISWYFVIRSSFISFVVCAYNCVVRILFGSSVSWNKRTDQNEIPLTWRDHLTQTIQLLAYLNQLIVFIMILICRNLLKLLIFGGFRLIEISAFRLHSNRCFDNILYLIFLNWACVYRMTIMHIKSIYKYFSRKKNALCDVWSTK